MKKRYIIPSIEIHKIQVASLLTEFSDPENKVIGEGDSTPDMKDVDMEGTGEGID